MSKWTYEVHELSEGFSAIVYDEHGQYIADHLSEETARLIASAPDLLEALEGMVAWTNHRWPGADISKSSLATPLAKARAAIARAKGEGS